MIRRLAAIVALLAGTLALSACGMLGAHMTTPAGPAPTSAAGSSSHELSVGGLSRTYRLYVPAGLTDPAPLVVMLHGGYGTAEQAEKSYGWDELADAQHAVIVYPEGAGRAWNAGGGCCGSSARNGVDDVAFVSAVVDAVGKQLAIDRDRVYAAGMSNGAMMAYRLACETTLFAAIGPVAGTIPVGLDCAHPPPVSVMAVSGRDDTRVLYDGGVSTVGSAQISSTPQQTMHALWSAADGCGSDTITDDPPLTIAAASCPQGRAVELVSIAGYGHEWPSPRGAATPYGEEVYAGWDATAQLWAFFAAHPRPADVS